MSIKYTNINNKRYALLDYVGLEKPILKGKENPLKEHEKEFIENFFKKTKRRIINRNIFILLSLS